MALADSVLDQLEPSVNTPDPTSKDYHYWIIMMHTIHEMLVDSKYPLRNSYVTLLTDQLVGSRVSDRSSVTFSCLFCWLSKSAVVLAFSTQCFGLSCGQISSEKGAGTEDSTKSKVAAFGMKKILDLYVLVANWKYITDSTSQFTLLPRSDRHTRDSSALASQLVVDLRLAVLPVLEELWQSDLIEEISDQTLVIVVDILNLVSAGDCEPPDAYGRKA